MKELNTEAFPNQTVKRTKLDNNWTVEIRTSKRVLTHTRVYFVSPKGKVLMPHVIQGDDKQHMIDKLIEDCGNL